MSNNLLDDQTVQKLIASSVDVMTDAGYFTQCMWHVDDVHLLCEQRGWPALSHQEAKAVFAIFSELYEGDQGLTWAKLEQATQVYLAQQGKVKHTQSQRSPSAESIAEMTNEQGQEKPANSDTPKAQRLLPSELFLSARNKEKVSES